MSSSEVPSSCIVENVLSASNILSDSPSFFSQKSQSSQSLSQSSQNGNRKRRANVSKINLSSVGPGGANGAQRPPGESSGVFGSQDSLNSANGISDDDNCDSPIDEAYEKRVRLTSQSLSQCSSSTNDEAFDQITELECSQGSASVKNPIPSGNGKIIGDYELVGSGRNIHAVHRPTSTLMHCQIFKTEEFKTFVTINERIKRAESIYHQSEFKHLKELIIPDGVVTLPGENGLWYVIMPAYTENLQSHLRQRRQVYTERQAQPIFKQIIELVEFCHHIGIYLRDFKLQKFVYTDEKRSKIRLNSILDLYVAPKIEDDSMSDRCVCPAYVAPEILDMKQKSYAAKPADIWGLGVLMFILLTGHYPFFDSNPRAFFRRIKSRRFSYPLSDSISYPARWLLYSLLRQNPIDRPSATELLHSLWLRTDPESLSDEIKETRRVAPSSSQPINSSSSQGQNFPTLTSSPSLPSLANATPSMRIFLAAPMTVETSLGARVGLTSDIAQDIDQTVPTMGPMTAPVITKESSEDSSRGDNMFFNIVNNASASDSQAHISSHI